MVGDVALKKHPLRWPKLPVAVKTALVAQVERVRRLRADIAREAQVPDMPRVRIVDVGWLGPGGCAHGRMTPLADRGSWCVGVELTAPAVLYADDQALRGVLLHEFSHGFNLIRRVLRAEQAGEVALELRPAGDAWPDDAWDRKMLEDPADWFGSEDAQLFPYWHSRLLEKCTDRIVAEWIEKGLPTEPALAGYEIKGRVSIPNSIVAHIRRLEVRGQSPTKGALKASGGRHK